MLTNYSLKLHNPPPLPTAVKGKGEYDCRKEGGGAGCPDDGSIRSTN